MKTSEKIKRGLECDCCADCPYSSVENGCTWSDDYALAYIQQLEVDRARQDAYILRLENELGAVKRERDAAVKDMWFSAHCVNCKYRGKQENCDGTGCCYSCELDCPCAKFPCGYEWRGVCPENTEVQDDD